MKRNNLFPCLAFALIFSLLGSAFTRDVHNFKVRYSLHGLSKQIIVAAESSNDARETVKALFPEATVYSAIKVH
jgi:hypothetical protein